VSSAQIPKITNDWLNLVGHRMLYSCTHMATAGVKWLMLIHVVSLCVNVCGMVM